MLKLLLKLRILVLSFTLFLGLLVGPATVAHAAVEGIGFSSELKAIPSGRSPMLLAEAIEAPAVGDAVTVVDEKAEEEATKAAAKEAKKAAKLEAKRLKDQLKAEEKAAKAQAKAEKKAAKLEAKRLKEAEETAEEETKTLEKAAKTEAKVPQETEPEKSTEEVEASVDLDS